MVLPLSVWADPLPPEKLYIIENLNIYLEFTELVSNKASYRLLNQALNGLAVHDESFPSVNYFLWNTLTEFQTSGKTKKKVENFREK